MNKKKMYSAEIFIKLKDNEDVEDHACFGSVIFNKVEYFTLEIDEDLSIDNVSEYFNFLKSFIPNFSKTIDITIDSKKRIVKVLLKKINDKTISDRKKYLTVFSLLRYIQEFPEIVKYLSDNEFSWSCFAKAHGHWNDLKKVKYRNSEHSISSNYGVLSSFCEQDIFIERFKTSNISRIADLFKE